MFDFNWAELLIISVVALIVIGPEDLPQMFRQLGRFTAKLRQMSREFSRAMEQAAKDTGVADVAKDLKTATSAKSLGLDAVKGSMDKFEKWDPLKNAAKPSMPARSLVPPPMPATPPQVSSLTSVAARDAAAVPEDMPSIEDEMAEDLADLETLDGVEPTIHGPNTQALYDKAALRAKVLAEQTEKLKAIEAGTFVAEGPVSPGAADTAKPAPKKRVTKPKLDAPVAAPVAAEKPKRAAAKKADAPATPKPKKPRKAAGEETA